MKRILAALLAFLFATSAIASSTEQWVNGNGNGGAGLTWIDACGTGGADINSLASGNAKQCTTVFTNGTALDIFADISVSLASLTSGAGSPTFSIYLYRLNQDGTTYGDGLYATSAAGPPNVSYFACAIPVNPSVTAAIVGSCQGIVLPPGSFVLVPYNNTGVNALAASANALKIRTYNRQQH